MALAISGFPGFEDLRIYRMLLDDFWWGVGDFYLSESGFPGFEDLWLTPRFAIRMLLNDFWWGVGDFSGCF